MSITNNGGIYDLECDICGDDAGEDFDMFYEAVAFKKDKANGWISKRVDGEWQDICPDCQKPKE